MFMVSSECLAEITHKRRTKTVGDSNRQASPQGNEGTILGVQGIVLGMASRLKRRYS
jgi:hypothetical protein